MISQWKIDSIPLGNMLSKGNVDNMLFEICNMLPSMYLFPVLIKLSGSYAIGMLDVRKKLMMSVER